MTFQKVKRWVDPHLLSKYLIRRHGNLFELILVQIYIFVFVSPILVTVVRQNSSDSCRSISTEETSNSKVNFVCYKFANVS